jgi:flavin-binding protein dodecin
MAGFEIIEKVGISTKSYSDAVTNAISSLQNEKQVFWFEVVEQRGRVKKDNTIEFQVIIKIGCN